MVVLGLGEVGDRFDSTEVFRRLANGNPATGCDIHLSVIFESVRFHTLSCMRDEPLTHSFTAGERDGTTILKLSGPLTISTMFGFQDELRAVKAKVLIIDLSETPYMDSAGLGLIMNSHVSAQDQGRKLLLAGVNERVKALFEMTKVQAVLTSFPSVAEAEASL